jgi:hypothetical protein
MKEASGEANLTVITIILMSLILPAFYFIIPQILNGIKSKACCISNNGKIDGNSCVIKSWIRANDGEKGVKYEQVEKYYAKSYINQSCK